PFRPEGRYETLQVFISDGWLWSKVYKLFPTEDVEPFVPIKTETGTYETDFGRSHNCPDDIDERDDTVLQSEQKMDKFLHSILPTKRAGTLFICAQNLVIDHGVINRIVTGQVPALANARISGPHLRVE